MSVQDSTILALCHFDHFIKIAGKTNNLLINLTLGSLGDYAIACHFDKTISRNIFELCVHFKTYLINFNGTAEPAVFNDRERVIFIRYNAFESNTNEYFSGNFI